jgi:centromere-localized protein 2
MAPSETSILSNFLLPPAPLPMVVTLAQFRRLFPRPTRDRPAVRALYAELAHQVSLGVDEVKRNIAAEVRRGVALRRQVREARRRAMRGARWVRVEGRVSADARMDAQVGGGPLSVVRSKALIIW